MVLVDRTQNKKKSQSRLGPDVETKPSSLDFYIN